MRVEIQTTEFYEFMEQTDMKCQTDHGGSVLLKWIRILVKLKGTQQFIIYLDFFTGRESLNTNVHLDFIFRGKPETTLTVMERQLCVWRKMDHHLLRGLS